jgi:Mg2+/Co2+ transporter CorB
MLIELGSEIIVLVVMIIVSGFFSLSEAALLSLNSYQLKHWAKTDRSARLISKLLKRPDRLLGVLIIGNTVANIAASSLATVIGMRLYGELGVLVTTIILTFVLLIFAEILPKTLGNIKAQVTAKLIVWPLRWILWLLFPAVWLANIISNSILRCFGVVMQKMPENLSIEELRTLVTDATNLMSDKHKIMLASILDLEKLAVDDVMIPRSEIWGINLDDSLENIKHKLTQANHTIIPVYRSEIDKTIGIVHIRDVAKIIMGPNFSVNAILNVCQTPYFVPQATSLHKQLTYFQQNKARLAMVVDEYGEIIGLITMANILEEIVGEFTTDDPENKDIRMQADGSCIVDGSVNIRMLNRTMNWNFSTNKAKTISGLVIEHLEDIPQVKAKLNIDGYSIEVLVVQDNTVKTLLVAPETSST